MTSATKSRTGVGNICLQFERRVLEWALRVESNLPLLRKVMTRKTKRWGVWEEPRKASLRQRDARNLLLCLFSLSPSPRLLSFATHIVRDSRPPWNNDAKNYREINSGFLYIGHIRSRAAMRRRILSRVNRVLVGTRDKRIRISIAIPTWFLLRIDLFALGLVNLEESPTVRNWQKKYLKIVKYFFGGC